MNRTAHNTTPTQQRWRNLPVAGRRSFGGGFDLSHGGLGRTGFRHGGIDQQVGAIRSSISLGMHQGYLRSEPLPQLT